MLNLALIDILVSLLVAGAGAADRTPAQICDSNLTGDQRLALLGTHPPDAPAVAVARARLVNEAWWPAMVHLHRIVTALDDDFIATLGRRWRSSVEASPSMRFADGSRRLARARREGYFFDRAYDAFFKIDFRHAGDAIHEMHFPHVGPSRDFMAKVRLTTVVLGRLIDERDQGLRDTFPAEGREVLRAHSFTRTRAAETLLFALETFAQAFALVTASPVGDLSAEELARRASAPRPTTAGRRRGASSLERLALGMPPGTLGRFGNEFFVIDALRLNANGQTELSPNMLDFMDHARRAWSQKTVKAHYEFGYGCPVAYPSPRPGARSGVGLGLETFWHVYDRLP